MRTRSGQRQHAKSISGPYYGKINLDVESESLLGAPDACAKHLGSLFARGIETVILRLVKPDLVQLDLLAEKVLPRLQIL